MAVHMMPHEVEHWKLLFEQEVKPLLERIERLERIAATMQDSEDAVPTKWLVERLRDLARELVADPKTPWIGERKPELHICWTAADRISAALRTPDEAAKASDWQIVPKKPTELMLQGAGHHFIASRATVQKMWEWMLSRAPQPVDAAQPVAATPSEDDPEQPYVEMLWKWFGDESRCGAEYMRAEMPEGLSADDFRNMLDEHEASLLADIALKQPVGVAQPSATTPTDLSIDLIAVINRRLEDLAEANAIYHPCHAPDKIARNDREISWLKDLRSMIVMRGAAQSPPHPKGEK